MVIFGTRLIGVNCLVHNATKTAAMKMDYNIQVVFRICHQHFYRENVNTTLFYKIFAYLEHFEKGNFIENSGYSKRNQINNKFDDS